MRDFSKVSPQLWGKRQFKALSTEGKLAMLYFLTCRHQTSAGCYELPDGYASSDLGWDAAVYTTARREVEEAGLIIFDDETSEIYIAGWYAENPVTNDKHYLGCQRIIGFLNSAKIQSAADEEMHGSEEKRRDLKSSRRD